MLKCVERFSNYKIAGGHKENFAIKMKMKIILVCDDEKCSLKMEYFKGSFRFCFVFSSSLFHQIDEMSLTTCWKLIFYVTQNVYVENYYWFHKYNVRTDVFCFS